MRYQSPSDLAANSVSHKHHPDVEQAGGGGGAIGNSPGPAIFSVPGLLTQDCPLRVGDPDVLETSTGYKLIFNLPPDVKGDGLDVSVSGRLLTVEARVTRGGGAAGGGGGGEWETPFTRTHSAARSFVIPVGVSNEVTASWVSDGRVEIKLDKLPSHSSSSSAASADAADAAEVDTAAAAAAAAAAGVATSPTAAMEDWGGVAVEGKDKPPSVPSSAAEGYLSSLTGTSSPPAAGGGTIGAQSSSSDPSEESLASATPAGTASTAAWPSHRRSRDRSMLAALDDEFRHLAKSMWDDAVRFPTEEQVAATVARARHERAKRVRWLRRATMATDVSERELSYVVRVSLPEGATREDVELSVTPDNALRVAFSPKDRPPISKVVHLPLDAIFSNVSAKFNGEKSQQKDGNGVSNSGGGGGGGGGVSSLEVTLGRSPPLLPMSIDIE